MTITIVFCPTREGDITLALRALLKRALRCYGLRAIKIEITPPPSAASSRAIPSTRGNREPGHDR